MNWIKKEKKKTQLHLVKVGRARCCRWHQIKMIATLFSTDKINSSVFVLLFFLSFIGWKKEKHISCWMLNRFVAAHSIPFSNQIFFYFYFSVNHEIIPFLVNVNDAIETDTSTKRKKIETWRRTRNVKMLKNKILCHLSSIQHFLFLIRSLSSSTKWSCFNQFIHFGI